MELDYEVLFFKYGWALLLKPIYTLSNISKYEKSEIEKL